MATRTIHPVDTNVAVAGLLATDTASSVARVLDDMLSASLPYGMCEALLGEHRTVPRTSTTSARTDRATPRQEPRYVE